VSVSVSLGVAPKGKASRGSEGFGEKWKERGEGVGLSDLRKGEGRKGIGNGFVARGIGGKREKKRENSHGPGKEREREGKQKKEKKEKKENKEKKEKKRKKRRKIKKIKKRKKRKENRKNVDFGSIRLFVIENIWSFVYPIDF
jgi:hypothetical protein